MKKEYFISFLVSSILYGTAVAQDAGNTIYIEQVGKANVLEVEQTGSENKLFLKQVGDNILNQAIIQQLGSGNEADIYNKDQIKNVAIQKQYGNDNKVGIYLQGKNNTVLINQFGNENKSYIQQLENDNLFRLEQNGSGNNVGTAGNKAFTQDGDGNKFAGVTNEVSLAFDKDGYAKQSGGAVLDIDSYQSGNDNQIGLQQGAGDMGLIQQKGDENKTLLWQSGGGQDATIIQNGIGNTVNLKQK